MNSLLQPSTNCNHNLCSMVFQVSATTLEFIQVYFKIGFQFESYLDLLIILESEFWKKRLFVFKDGWSPDSMGKCRFEVDFVISMNQV